MKRVRINKFKDYPFQLTSLKNLLPYNYKFLFPKPMFLVSMGCFLFLSFIHLKYLPYFMSLSSVYLYSLIIIKKQRKGILIKREFKEKTKEEKDELFEYSIKNPYAFHLDNILIMDSIEASINKRGKTDFTIYMEKARGNGITIERKILKMNNGMGKKSIGPLVMMAADVLGIQRITFIDETPRFIKVMPLIYPTKMTCVRPDLLGSQFGLFDSYSKGENVNFYATREYVQGDHVKKINWKLSLKTNEIIVNEFEKNINASVLAVLVDDNRIHFGSGRISSLEYCKDILLSLMYQQFKNYNSVGVLSHQKMIPIKSSAIHMDFIEHQLSEYELPNFDRAELYHKSQQDIKEAKTLEKKILYYTNRETNIFIFIPLLNGKVFLSYLKSVKSLRAKGFKIHVVLIYGFISIIRNLIGEDRIWLLKLQETLAEDLKEAISYLKNSSIKVSAMEIKDSEPYKDIIKEAFRAE